MPFPIGGQSPVGSRLGKIVLSLVLATRLLPAGDGPPRLWTSAPYPSTFEHISVAQGLSESIVHWIEQDARGFLWFATDSGLNRYDGYRFLVFRPDKQNPQGSLGGNKVTCLLMDHRHLLWIATDGGLSCLDPETLDIQTYRASSEPGALPSNSILRLVEDKAGNIWIGTEENGLCLLPRDWTPSTHPRFQVLANEVRDPHGPPTGFINALHVDHCGAVWFGSRDMGLGRIIHVPGQVSMKFEYFPHDPARPVTSPPATLNAIREDPLGGLWVGSNDGLYFFDPDRGLWQRYVNLGQDPGTRTSNVMLALNLDRSGTLWISIDGGGLSRLLPRSHSTDTPQFQTFRHDPKDPGSLSSDGVQFVFEDNSDVLWVSAYLSGLNKLVLNPEGQGDRRKRTLFQYRNIAADPGSLSGNHVAALCEDRFGNLWIGTDGAGVNRVSRKFSRKEGLRFEHFRARPGAPGALQDDVVLAIHRDSQQRLWLGTYNAGIVRVDQESGTPRFTHYRSVPGDPESLSSDFIRDILDDGRGRLWIGGNRGLNLFNPKTGKVRRYALGKDGRAWMRASAEINKLVLDSYGTLWMATPDGLNRMNIATGECRGYVPGGPGSLSDVNILTIHIDRKSNLWVGTLGGGLNKAVIPAWDGPAPQFVHFGPKEGLPGWEVKCILEDDAGQLWLSGNREMYRFDPAKGQGHAFPFQSENQRGEFIKNSGLRLASGEMLFGSNDGFSLFHPKDLSYNGIPPPIVLTDVQILNKSISLKDRLQRGKDGNPRIEIHPGESTFTISFSALHYVAPFRNQYSYCMEGLDRTWNEAGDQHSISFAKLPPGHYLLRVRGSNCDGVWGKQELCLGIEVPPAWYQTWWFRTLTLAFIAGAAFTSIQWYLSSLRKRNRYLEEAVAEQTRKLREAEALSALAHLTETAGNASEDLKHWVDGMAQEVSKAIDARYIDVWEVFGELFEPVTDTQEMPLVSLSELLRGKQGSSSDQSDLHPVPGPQGEVHAALRIVGKESPWSTLERQLLASFIHHLGGAYHLKWLRQTLAENRRQRALDRETLLAQGSGALQLCPACKACYDEETRICAKDGASLVSPRLLPFRFQGRYRLVKLLGEGATAQVFEAWDEKLDRVVALKAIKPQNFIMEQTRERFTREARILARLDHPGIVSIYDSGELEDGTVFLVMERLHGTTVGSLLRAYGPARPGQAAFLLRQVASALASTHAKGLVHRDLKPENLFAVASAEWLRYKVLDFGLAKTQVTDTGLTQSGTLMGTPNYMSPEQVRGRAVDWRSDLYSLSAILYEILSGRGVVESRVLAEVFVEVLSKDPTPLTSLIPGCPLEVDSLISQGLLKDPRQRPMDLLAWTGKLDAALQAWGRVISGWPDRYEELDVAFLGVSDPMAGEVLPTLQPGFDP